MSDRPAHALASALSASAARHADRPAILLDGPRPEVLRYDELFALVETRREQLRRIGVGAGQIVPLYTARTPQAIAVAIAALFEGAAFTFLNAKFRLPQLRLAVELARPSALIVDESALAALTPSEHEGLRALRPLWLGPADARRPSLESAAKRDAAPADHGLGVGAVVFTSGSTGAPKGVLISADDLLRRARTEIDGFELSELDRLLCLLPLSFDVALNQLISSLLCGAALHVSGAWMRGDLHDVIDASRITGISASPGVWSNAMRGVSASERLLGETPSLRYVTISGGSLSAAAFERLATQLAPHVAIHRTYGQSESFRSACFLRANAPEHVARRGSVGPAVPGTRVVIVRADGGLAATGELGQVVHIGDGTMLRYLGDEALTRDKLRVDDGLGATAVYTGDLGHLDAGGYLYLSGREDAMVKVAGFRVYPREIEEALATHPMVEQAVVFGVDDAWFGTRLVAVLVLRPGAETAAIRAWLTERVPSYMVPREVVAWDELPSTETGKPALQEIRERYVMRAPEPRATYAEVVREAARALGHLGADDRLIHVDSISVLELIAEIETATGLEIPSANLRVERFDSVESFVELIDTLRIS